jgi:hypothetical protein
MLRRADLRIAAPEIDERLAGRRRRLGDACQERREVLLREPV